MRLRGDERNHDLALDRLNVKLQIDEDTCDKHGVFCCPQCFDMGLVDDEGDSRVGSR